MVKSMTAFGRRETNGEWGQLSCELRAVNHRYLEVSVRLPEELRAIEMAAREKIGKR
ncbi:MAG: YicC/YloC family endoribonuclease, partial [Pseudomonadota bacterium]